MNEWQGKRKQPAPVLPFPPQIPRLDWGSNPGRLGAKPTTNRLSYRLLNPNVYSMHIRF
jgi:hypothetical protein